MKYMSLNEVREAYLSFFERKEHLRLESYPLVPKNDKSLLLINAGMAPLKPYFTGLQTPPKKRITTCQKCIRTGDIENVGKTSRHGTFFEMLGNFSFGDYFKEEIIPWAWEFVTKELAIPKEKLYVTIYLEDDEAFDIWSKKTDIDPTRIFRLGKEDNFWEIGQGPCGPCSEIHYDRGTGKINSVEEFTKAADEDRVVEFWNLVFTQFDKDENGVYNRLANPNIDTGMGLERIATIMQGTNNIFEVDSIKSILDKISETAVVKYGSDNTKDISLRIIADHIRSVTFMTCDGVLPSNEGRGYVLRRLLRRAARHGKILGINGTFLYNLCDIVIENSNKAYPELEEKKDYIKNIIKLEEERFSETIDSGMNILMDYVEELKKNNTLILQGKKVFKLYDTYGFPVELTEEILTEKGLKLDLEGFNSEMEEQRKRAREARAENNYMGSDDSIVNKIPPEFNTEFEGYDDTKLVSNIVLLIENNEFVDVIKAGENGIIISEKTPFYAEMGGQIGDRGMIYGENFKALVIDCKKNISGKIMHIVEIVEGYVSTGDEVTLEVDLVRRNNIRKNHTATHLLHEALREVVGLHVQQSGSLVDEEKLRFDFSHFTSVTEEEVMKVEMLVNNKIMETLKVDTDVMTINEAKEKGAMALFDEKYGDKVRVVSVGEFSKELCGGTHVFNTGEIGLFKIVSESGVAAGIRRIEAVTGFNALNNFNNKIDAMKEVSSILKCSTKDVKSKVQLMLHDMKEKEKEISDLKSQINKSLETEIVKNVKSVKGIKFISVVVKNVDIDGMRELGDRLKNKLEDGVVVLGSSTGEKVSIIAMATSGVVKKGVHCGKLVKEVSAITGGSGGGRPDMAQAGGKYPEKLNEAINIVEKVLETLVK